VKTTPSLTQIRPSAHNRYRQLPIFGRFLDDFVPWAFARGYTIHAVFLQLDSVRHLEDWFQRRGRRSVKGLTANDLAAAHRHFSRRPHDPRYAWGLRGFGVFLQEQGCIKTGRPKPLTRSEQEVARFAKYLRKARGVADSTGASAQRRIRPFLDFIGFEHDASALKNLTLEDVFRYLRSLSGRYQRKTMQQVVGNIRGFLRFQLVRGAIRSPLHLQIDTVRVYRSEHLPYPVKWSQLQQLLRCIDRSTPLGLRDYAVLLLAATYGLRASDVASLALDDIDWRKRTIQIVQCKTRQPLALPLTDDVGAALADYIRRGRPSSSCRYIFLRRQAPIAPLSLPGMSNTLRRASKTAGIMLKASGFRCLRHAVALRLLRQGTLLKSIGDILGHRSSASTSEYLRLNVEDLRQIALPVPTTSRRDVPRKKQSTVPRSRRRAGTPTAPRGWGWRSFLGTPMRDYLATQRALGRAYETQEYTLRGLDFFLASHYPQAESFTAAMFAAWAVGLRSLCPTTARMRMLCIRKFCCHLERSRPGMFIPNLSTFPKELPHQVPYLFSEQEVARVLAATDTLRCTRRNPLHPQTIRLAILLTFCCGLRLGEVLHLRLADIDTGEMVLHINETKFHKSRLVPISSSVAEEVRQYLTQRLRENMPMEPSAPLVWNGLVRRKRRAHALAPSNLWATWRRVCCCADVIDHRGRPPRFHDLRHSFAVEALRRAYSTGKNAQALLPQLSCYMGHVGVQFTHYYLKFTEPLRCVSSERFRQHILASILPAGDLQEGGAK